MRVSWSAQPRGRTAASTPRAVSVHAQGAPAVKRTDGYIAAMRKKAIALHSPEMMKKRAEEARKKGPDGKVIKQNPKLKPTLQGYLQFLQESKVLYDYLEGTVQQRDELASLRGHGMERAAALERDIEWYCSEIGMLPHELDEESAGHKYVSYLQELMDTDMPAFMCHYYNTYFAHTAGGMMIGKTVSQAILEGVQLEFYKYDQDLVVLKESLKARIEKLAGTWTAEELQRSVDETENCFKWAGAVMKCITKSFDEEL